jgi:Fatty acid/phospholipid biosynthesis enzyme
MNYWIKSDINFIGNIEARDVPKGKAEVIVCDGFVGNVILKLTEGLAWNILKLLKAKFTAGIKSKLGALLLKDKFGELKSEFDYSEYGGAPILGIKGAVVKIHGSSNANAVMNAILKEFLMLKTRWFRLFRILWKRSRRS